MWLTQGGWKVRRQPKFRAPAGGVVGRVEVEVEVEVEVVEGGGRARRTSRATGRRKRKMEAADQTHRPQT